MTRRDGGPDSGLRDVHFSITFLPGNAGERDGDMVARVSLSPDPLDARFSYGWRLPGFYNADVQLMLPSLPERLPNATLFPGLTRTSQVQALAGFKC